MKRGRWSTCAEADIVVSKPHRFDRGRCRVQNRLPDSSADV